MPKNNFDKFINKPVKGAKIKEAIKQEKKAAAKERREAIDRHYEEKRKSKHEKYTSHSERSEESAPNSKTPFPRTQHNKDSKAKNTKVDVIPISSKTRKEPPIQAKQSQKHLHPHATSSKKPFRNEKHDERKNKVKSKKDASSFSKEKGAGRVDEANNMPLNKFIAHAGVCSRREAADLVRTGVVTVNGEKILEPAFKVTDQSVISVNGKKIQRSKNLVYILMNKPKDYITTAEDPQGRKTVMDIIKHATKERVYPVGRLDRNTSGILLLTNDGDLAQRLSHPSFEVRKVYEVRLDKILTKDDFNKILNGIELEDGKVTADSLAYADSKDKRIIGIELHSGRNRIVRRIFEHLGYDVRGLDRVMYANLTKKNVERGKWRFLNDKEIRLLKYFKSGK